MRRGAIVITAILGALTAAPTAGDVGGCGKEATLLDLPDFAEARKEEDCRRCTDCELSTQRCTRSCDVRQPPVVELPQTCQPLRRDGEVCLRALRAASCTDFASYVDDVAPSTPTECAFCKVGPGGTAGTFSDGAAP